MIKKFLKILFISLMHFATVSAITWLGLWVIVGRSIETGVNSFLSPVFVWFSRILYFPIITLSLFPRNLFPGWMVYIPIALNSLMWGICIYMLFYFIGIWRQRVSRVKNKRMQDIKAQLSINPKAHW
jgi:drug/metabolite transporter (DMT)-like permease